MSAHTLQELNFYYLSTIKELAIEDMLFAQLQSGLSFETLNIITNCSFRELNAIARKDSICFKLNGNEQTLRHLLTHHQDNVAQLADATTSFYTEDVA